MSVYNIIILRFALYLTLQMFCGFPFLFSLLRQHTAGLHSSLRQAFGLGPVMHLCMMAPPSTVVTVPPPSTPSGRNSTYPKAWRPLSQSNPAVERLGSGHALLFPLEGMLERRAGAGQTLGYFRRPRPGGGGYTGRQAPCLCDPPAERADRHAGLPVCV